MLDEDEKENELSEKSKKPKVDIKLDQIEGFWDYWNEFS